MIVTNSEEYYEIIKKLKNHGSSKRYHHDIIGFNSRLDEIQAAILNIKLKYIDKLNLKRVGVANMYNSLLADIKNISLPKKNKNGHHVYHQYTISSDLRDEIKLKLEENNIGSAIYYPISLEKQKAYTSNYQNLENYKNSNFLSNTCLSLPMFPQLAEENIIEICNVIKKIK
jgi:dTDP-4-amino-4,6-dideoxygalactose transaminase